MDAKEEIKKRFFYLVRVAIFERWEGVESKKDIAKITGISPQQLYAIETEKGRNPTLQMVHNFCKKLKISPNYIILGIEPVRFSDKNNFEQRLKALEIKLLKL